MSPDDAASLYPARVAHRRRVPPCYRFVYRVFYLLIDIDRLDQAQSGVSLFSCNRFNLLSFHEADHGDGQRGGLRRWAGRILSEAGLEGDVGRIRLLCLPRVLGHVFDPISLWYCDRPDGRAMAVIAEVNNTFGERHCYVLASASGGSPYEAPVDKDKCFHVSPFLDPIGRYRFDLALPGKRLRVHIHETREGRPILDATLAGERRELRNREILGQVLRLPLMTLKVVVAIHWQALKIWWRGGHYHPKPAPPPREAS